MKCQMTDREEDIDGQEKSGMLPRPDEDCDLSTLINRCVIEEAAGRSRMKRSEQM